MGRPSNSLERRRQIISGLLDVMAQKGYSGATIQEIARAAGLTPGLVHYHFPSKKDVLLAMVPEIMGRILTRYHVRLAPARTAWDRLDALIDAHLALGRDADPLAVACWVSVAAEALRDADVRAAYRDAIARDLELMEELLADVLREDGRDPAAASMLARALLAAIQGIFQLAVTADTAPTGQAAERVRDMARGLVAVAEVTS